MGLAIRHSRLTAPPLPPVVVGSWPKLSDTGTTGTLAANSSGNLITANNVLIENKIFSGMVEVKGSNVTFRNCRFQDFDPYAILQYDQAPDNSVNCRVENCHIDGGGRLSSKIALCTLGAIINCNIEGVTLGASFFGPQTVVGNYIHNLDNPSTDPNQRHFDGLVSFGGGNHLIENNAIVMLPQEGGTAAISLNPTFGPIDNVMIRNNLCMGRAAYTIATEEATRTTVRDNFLDLGIFGWIANEVPITDINNTLFNAGTAQQTPGYVNPIPHSIPPEVQAWLAKT